MRNKRYDLSMKTRAQILENLASVLLAYEREFICGDAAIGALKYMAYRNPDESNLILDALDEVLRTEAKVEVAYEAK